MYRFFLLKLTKINIGLIKHSQRKYIKESLLPHTSLLTYDKARKTL